VFNRNVRTLPGAPSYLIYDTSQRRAIRFLSVCIHEHSLPDDAELSGRSHQQR